MGQLIDLTAARVARGLDSPIVPVQQPPRPTLLEAIRQYGENSGLFDDARHVNGSAIVHKVRYWHPDSGWGASKCGQGGTTTPPDLHALVCLRCWPWWKA